MKVRKGVYVDGRMELVVSGFWETVGRGGFGTIGGLGVYLGLLCWRGEKDDEVERERRLGMAMVWGEGAGFQGMGIDFGEKMKKKEKDEGVGVK